MEIEKKRLNKTNRKQYELLLECVEENKILISGKTKPSDSNKINQLWVQIADKINSQGYGPQKTGAQRNKIFNEWKVNIRRKSRQIKENFRATGGGPGDTKKLTDLEERVLNLITKIHLGD